MPDRPWLHIRIEQRLDIMWNDGLVTEVIGLLERYPLTPNLPSMRCVGYRQVLEYLVHIDHPVFEQPHLDKAQFYSTFEVLQSSAQSSLSEGATEALACQQMQNKALYATRQLAKRQYTWLRKVMQLPSNSMDGAIAADTSSEKGYSIDRNMVVKAFTTMAQARDYLY